ncbi:hypothetical protein SLEP1_g41025 [Rubroshorea leprosula]|uniref:Reverse transcriptase Ty1/copia-type domain-containing protein n=1 Tax=Rubroshorea leprosula TaxID=152421 RepID=A0AAV5L5N0_9ROSI|nr:hypothetical protein SLEP1_g41025 [Rubroshorea leprosula]
MVEEIGSIERNQTWELTDLLKGHKTISVKWIYKTKLKENGEPRVSASASLPPPTLCTRRVPPTTATHFPAGNPAKLGDFSLFSCLRTPVEPRKSQICVFLPLLSAGFNLWV